ncbi:hypothetical protein BS78_05G068100 [Paspalum vaginatum]|nr:hypothetical protein BS78_05G068100 [Paspalum vaginatum]
MLATTSPRQVPTSTSNFLASAELIASHREEQDPDHGLVAKRVPTQDEQQRRHGLAAAPCHRAPCAAATFLMKLCSSPRCLTQRCCSRSRRPRALVDATRAAAPLVDSGAD